ncbi:FdhF/YdeP family oxidoreductase [Nocardioides panacis]|uniref:FdhF/YdeP family oxidoreductase n=1 Tax=Nocardioides panacis TaxID=2849501 RepID=A0A975SXJ0_9ACTN|nr:FdhF/YdeP family oxidoreductase [Nocardioides panacis]QWZ07113.1 FdhF/YdeP family oxidoreductase [Nocardioides panacis]
MTRWTRDRDVDEQNVEVHDQKHAAAGITAVAVSMKRSLEQMGPVRTAKTLLKLNQADGFDCMSCAWPDPDPDHRHTAEFCENGAKAVAEEADTARVTPEFFRQHSLADLRERSEFWLGKQGRITEPMVLREGATHYEPISWDDAFALVGGTLNGLASPDQAVFYTSGRASNESAFSYQLFARAYGTNNLPDCSNMCHESTSIALQEVIGIGKASVSYQDVLDAKLIVIMGQNPGTNHPRMLTALEAAKKNGAKILAINPLKEAGFTRFKNPQSPRGVAGPGTELADLHLPVRINGDLALMQAIGSLLLEWGCLDRDFIERHTVGFEAWATHVRELDWTAVEKATDLSRAQIEEAAGMFRDSPATVTCWAMGVTQHRNAVATIKEISNVAFLQGNIGRPGAGLFPVRGHSNVQGDRTMGIWERAPQSFLDSIQKEFGFNPPREDGLDTVNAIRAFRDHEAKVFVGLGGNFVAAAPDTHIAEEALGNADLTVQISTKLNRSHMVPGRQALILPTLGRTEKDRTGGRTQRITVEDSVCAVHASQGPLEPASPHLRSETDIVCSIAEATLGDRHGIPWRSFRDDYTEIRKRIAHVVPGCEAYDEKVDRPGGFVLPHPPRDSRTFDTPEGAAVFSVSPLDVLHVPEGRLLMQTLRSHDQFNTTIYGLDDRYRGVSGGRRVVFVHPLDIAELGLEPDQVVDLVSEWTDGSERTAKGFRIVSYHQPRGCAAAYYPETNALIPLDSVALQSNCPTSKSVIIRLDPNGHGASGSTGRGGEQGEDAGHKSHPQPEHLS